jgi:hypothetical protein
MDRAIILLGLLAAALILILAAQRVRRRRAQRKLRELLKTYFEGGFSLEQLSKGARGCTSARFLHSSHFFALAVAAFQNAANDQLRRPHSAEDERRLLGSLAALKTKFGLADLYRTEVWRAGRE